MPYYMLQGNYTQAAVKNLVDRPENREAAASKIYKAVGGKLDSYFMCFGTHDFLAIGELPDDEAAAALSLAGGAIGHLANLKTTKLFTGAEAVKAMTRAGTARKALVPPKGK